MGKVVKGLGGLYDIRVAESDGTVSLLSCRAKGTLHREDERVLIGDEVVVRVDESVEGSVVISDILPRKNALIRPPLANLDYLFIVIATKKPAPVLETVDKLTAIAENKGIVPILIITKSDYSDDLAEQYGRIYKKAGFDVFLTSSQTASGVEELKQFLSSILKNGKTAAFAGASGVGKSTLLNALFPSLALATSEISHKIERGRHTTRHVELFALEGNSSDTGFLADTPGFSLIDFERFDFFSLEALPATFRDFGRYLGKCRYSDCTHVGEGEEDCAIMRAVASGEVEKSRLESYRSIWRVLKKKNEFK